MHRTSFRLGFLVSAALALSTVDARAADPAADALFTAGKTLLAEGKVSEACEKFEESHRLEPMLGALLNLANCREQEGRLATAWTRWGEAADLASRSGDARKDFADGRRRELEPRLPKLEIRVTGDPGGLLIFSDGAEVRTALRGVPVPVDPGEHVVEVAKDDEVLFRQKLVSVEGKPQVLELDLGKIATQPSLGRRQGAPPKKPAPVAPTPIETGTSTQAVVGFIVGGTGLAATAVGFVFGGLAMGRKNSADDPSNCTSQGSCAQTGLDDISRAETLSHLSTGLVIGGAALTSLGLVLVLTAPSDAASASELEQRAQLEPTIHLGLAPNPGGLGLGLGGSF
jgi:hypothetical protein